MVEEKENGRFFLKIKGRQEERTTKWMNDDKEKERTNTRKGHGTVEEFWDERIHHFFFLFGNKWCEWNDDRVSFF